MELGMVMQILLAIFLVLILFSHLFDNAKKDKANKLMTIFISLGLAKTVFDIFTWMIEGHPELEMLDSILTAGTFALSMPQLIVLVEYMLELINGSKKNTKNALYFLYVYGVIVTLLPIISIFVPFIFSCTDSIYRIEFFYVPYHFLYVLSMLFIIFILIIHRKVLSKRKKIFFYSYVIIPLICTILETVVDPQVDLVNVGITIETMLIYINIDIERKRLLAEKEEELAKANLVLTINQLQPHFIFNSISSIMAIPETNKKTKDALNDFATYLRVNLNSISSNKLIPFSQELEHIKVYVRLEQLRFGDRINVDYDIKEENFNLPSLTTQVLVENAIKHGIAPKRYGGKVTISTYQEKDCIVIIVDDNGIGFKVDEVETNNHFGLVNIKKRLDLIHGSIIIESEIDNGTKVIVKLPRNR